MSQDQIVLRDFKSYDLRIDANVAQHYVITDLDYTGSNNIEPINAIYRLRLQEASKVKLLIVLTQVQDCTMRIELDLLGNGAHADVIVLYALSGTQNVTINTLQKHQGKKTVSTVIARGIALGQAGIFYNGMILLEPGSAQAQAQQEHTTIVLSKQVKVVSVPSIEVLHHDVRCSHGAAIGQFHEQQLWYLQSRRFEKNEAYKMLVYSFFSEHIGHFPDGQKVLESLCQKIL